MGIDYTKVIENALREYKSKKSVIETSLARIEAYQKLINEHQDFFEVMLSSPVEPGMPKSHNGGSSPEFTTLQKDEAIKQFKEWIKEEESRIYPLQLEIDQIGKALEALNRQERFVIECKFFEKMIWRDIENSVNENFKQKEYITIRGLQHQVEASMKLITSILKPFYIKFGMVIAKNWQELKSA